MSSTDNTNRVPPWWSLRERLNAWWISSLKSVDSITLGQRNVYILPTRAGLLLAVTMLVLLAGSINYQISLGYLLTFLIAGCTGAGMWVCYANLRGLTLKVEPPEPVFAGTPALLAITLINTSGRARLSIGLARHGAAGKGAKDVHWSWADVARQGQSCVSVSWQPPRRGWWPAPALTAETRYPLGTFRVWTVWKPAATVMVYPCPETPCPPLPRHTPVPGQGLAGSAQASAEFEGVRAYRPGDPRKLLVWKKYARSGELVTRDTQNQQRQALWLDFAATGKDAAEQRLARLTAWVLAAHDQGLDYGLRLPGLEIAPAGGHAQRLRCLEALATC